MFLVEFYTHADVEEIGKHLWVFTSFPLDSVKWKICIFRLKRESSIWVRKNTSWNCWKLNEATFPSSSFHERKFSNYSTIFKISMLMLFWFSSNFWSSLRIYLKLEESPNVPNKINSCSVNSRVADFLQFPRSLSPHSIGL